jgi:hypothetical protein
MRCLVLNNEIKQLCLTGLFYLTHIGGKTMYYGAIEAGGVMGCLLLASEVCKDE